MRLSVLLTSFQRGNLLRWCLSSLRRQDLEDFEVIVLNDGIEDDTKNVCTLYPNVRYVFTGQRNVDGIKWRVPGFALNIGAKLATGRTLVLGCAEMYLVESDTLRLMDEAIAENPKRLVITEGKDDGSNFLRRLPVIENDHSMMLSQYYSIRNALNTKLPFFMAVSRDEYLDIGGYDEDFVGMAWDDNDFVDRMVANGCAYEQIPRRCVHLYHNRGVSCEQLHRQKWLLNRSIYERKCREIKRNIDREWGVLEK